MYLSSYFFSIQYYSKTIPGIIRSALVQENLFVSGKYANNATCYLISLDYIRIIQTAPTITLWYAVVCKNVRIFAVS